MINREVEFSLELLISAFKQNNFLTTQINSQDILHISSLVQNHEDIEIGLLKEYDQLRKNDIDLDQINSLKNDIDLQFDSLNKTILSINSTRSYLAFISDCLLFKYQYFYERYISVTKHIRDREIPLYKFTESDLTQIIRFTKILACNLLKYRVLERVQETLAFESVFNANIQENLKLKRVNIPADAVHEIMISNPEITITELIDIISTEYQIMNYQYNGKSETENSRKLKKAIRSAYEYRKSTW